METHQSDHIAHQSIAVPASQIEGAATEVAQPAGEEPVMTSQSRSQAGESYQQHRMEDNAVVGSRQAEQDSALVHVQNQGNNINTAQQPSSNAGNDYTKPSDSTAQNQHACHDDYRVVILQSREQAISPQGNPQQQVTAPDAEQVQPAGDGANRQSLSVREQEPEAARMQYQVYLGAVQAPAGQDIAGVQGQDDQQPMAQGSERQQGQEHRELGQQGQEPQEGNMQHQPSYQQITNPEVHGRSSEQALNQSAEQIPQPLVQTEHNQQPAGSQDQYQAEQQVPNLQEDAVATTNKINRISLTEQNEALGISQQEEPKYKQVVQFVQFTPYVDESRRQQEPADPQEEGQGLGESQEEEEKPEQLEGTEQLQTAIREQQMEGGQQANTNEEPDESMRQQAQIQDDQQEANNEDRQSADSVYRFRNKELLRRVQQLQRTVQALRQPQHNNAQTENAPVQQTTEQQRKVTKSVPLAIYDQSVHGLVQQLSKADLQRPRVKKPILRATTFRKKRLDLSSLMDKNMTLSSNVFNLTIGEILVPQKEKEEVQLLRREIKVLRQKVITLEEQKNMQTMRTLQATTRSNSQPRKHSCGKLIKVSELRKSNIFDNAQQFAQANGDAFQNSKLSKKQSLEMSTNKDKMASTFRVRRPSLARNDSTERQKSQKSEVNHDFDEKEIFGVGQLVLPAVWWEQPFIKDINPPEIPSVPSPFDSQQDLFDLAKLTFMSFGILVNKLNHITVRKYKNCVFFTISDKLNILWYFDGRFYIGGWELHPTGEGQKSGYGLQVVPSKFIYKGQFKQGKRHGLGVMKTLGEQKYTIYEGNWADGNKTGEGKQLDQNQTKYWGSWDNNKKHGFGRLRLKDGDTYEGNFDRGIKQGYGIEIFKNGDKYEGTYLANKFHSRGKYTWRNGAHYQGDFLQGIRSGQGKWRSSPGQEFDEYEGGYENDKKNGQGRYTWADGSQYVGCFKDDLKEGEGTIRYKNGKVAKLLWKNGQPVKKLYSEEEQKYRETQKKLIKNQEESQEVPSEHIGRPMHNSKSYHSRCKEPKTYS